MSTDPVLAWRAAVRNRYALGAVALTITLQVLALHLPGLARVLGTHPLTLREWAIALGLGLVPAVVGQGLRVRRSHGDPARSP